MIAYYLQTDGISKRKIQIVEITIYHHIANYPEESQINLLLALQFNLNNAFLAPIRQSPNTLTLSFKPRNVLAAITNTAGARKATTKLTLDLIQQVNSKEVEALITITSILLKLKYNKHYQLVTFQVGNIIYLQLHNSYNLPGKLKKKQSLS